MMYKVLNIQTKKQKEIISSDIETIMQKCELIATREYAEQKEARASHDYMCPHCHARKEENNIVEKFALVVGQSKIKSKFRLGYGTIDGFSNINTLEVNHCNVCGNQWKKFKIRYVSKTDIIRVALNYLSEVLENPAVLKFEWKAEAVLVFDDSNAESIYRLVEKNENYLHDNTLKVLTPRKLRKYYKSVFNETSLMLQKF